MEKAFEMGKTSATGSFQLLIGVAASTVIMAVGTVILTRLMTPADYGLYVVAMIPSLMISLFRDWGVNSAMAKNIATLRAAGKETEIKDIIVSGLSFEVATGLLLSILSFFIADFIATAIFHRPESTLFISIASTTIFAGSLLMATQAVFIGSERMGLYSLTVICQAIVKTLVGPTLVILGYDVLGAITGYAISFIAAGIIGTMTMYFALFKPLRDVQTNKNKAPKTLKSMLKYGVPLSISSILGGILVQFYAFMMAANVGDAMIGNYQAAVNFSVLLTFFTIPISTVLFPAFSKIDPQAEHEILRAVFASSIKYASMLLVPATMAVMVLSGPMISTLFGERYVSAPFFLTMYVISNLFVVLGNLSIGSFLTGIGKTKISMRQSILTIAIGTPLALMLIPPFGATGVIITTISAGVPSMLWGLHWISKRYKAKVDFKSSIRILAASALAAAAAYASLNLVHQAEWVRLAVGLGVFLATYIFASPMIGAITQSEINNARTMLSGLGIISKAVNIPLILTEKVLHLRPQTKKNAPSN